MTDPVLSPRVDIIIPTYNRAHLIQTAVRAALGQSWWNKRITVVDDASTDNTHAALAPFFRHEDFNYVRLARNVGTAQAKNAGLALTSGDAVTFHDSDDIPHRDKVLRQVRVLTQRGHLADECLNWNLVNRHSGEQVDVSAALVHHELILPCGRRHEIRRDLSVLDDLFPNLQFGSQVPGDWTHINSGLFRNDLFQRQGGFEDCIEEDREFRNRIILNGEMVSIIPELLLTKIETPDSLTQSAVSDYASARRKADRALVWSRVETWRDCGAIPLVPLHLPDLHLEFVSNPALLGARAMPSSPETLASVADILGPLASWASVARAAE